MAIKIVSPVEHSSGVALENAIVSIQSRFTVFKTKHVSQVENEETKEMETVVTYTYFVDFTKFIYLNQSKYDNGQPIFQENKRIEIPLADLADIPAFVYDDIKTEFPGATFENV
jgi:hypothetical protein